MRALISLITRSAIMRSRSVSSRLLEDLGRLADGQVDTSLMLRAVDRDASDSGLSRAPPHAGHGTSRM